MNKDRLLSEVLSAADSFDVNLHCLPQKQHEMLLEHAFGAMTASEKRALDCAAHFFMGNDVYRSSKADLFRLKVHEARFPSFMKTMPNVKLFSLFPMEDLDPRHAMVLREEGFPFLAEMIGGGLTVFDFSKQPCSQNNIPERTVQRNELERMRLENQWQIYKGLSFDEQTDIMENTVESLHPNMSVFRRLFRIECGWRPVVDMAVIAGHFMEKFGAMEHEKYLIPAQRTLCIKDFDRLMELEWDHKHAARAIDIDWMGKNTESSYVQPTTDNSRTVVRIADLWLYALQGVTCSP